MNARPLNVAKIIYIFQLLGFVSRGYIGVEGGDLHVPQERWDGKCKYAIPEPIACCGEGDGLRPNLRGKDFRWVCP